VNQNWQGKTSINVAFTGQRGLREISLFDWCRERMIRLTETESYFADVCNSPFQQLFSEHPELYLILFDNCAKRIRNNIFIIR